MDKDRLDYGRGGSCAYRPTSGTTAKPSETDSGGVAELPYLSTKRMLTAAAFPARAVSSPLPLASDLVSSGSTGVRRI